jgi:ppGpp synthetase/RelA/SpoT-type nucleotidyltranferase
MVPSEVEQWLSGISGARREVAKRAGDAVRRYCDRHNYAYAGRDKTSESIAEKIETGRISDLEELDDLFGSVIIIPSLAREKQVIDDLNGMFNCVALRSRDSSHKNPDVFRFEATRFIGRLKVTEIDDPAIGRLSFEVQVRTAFEHAWSVATHSEAYKSAKIDWKRERLAAQMKALVEQLDGLAFTYEASADSIVQHPCEQTECAAYMLASMQQLCADLPIPEECAPERWGLFAKNVISLAHAANWGRYYSLRERIERLATAARTTAKGMGSAAYPRSISLFQFVLGSAIQEKEIQTTFRQDDYYPPISEAMELIFPRTRKIAQRCKFANPSEQIEGAPTADA